MKNTELSCHFLLQGIFLTQCRSHVSCIGRQILYHWATKQDYLSVKYNINYPRNEENKQSNPVFNYYFHTHRTTLPRCSKFSEQLVSNSVLTLSGTSNRQVVDKAGPQPHRSHNVPGYKVLPGVLLVRAQNPGRQLSIVHGSVGVPILAPDTQ